MRECIDWMIPVDIDTLEDDVDRSIIYLLFDYSKLEGSILEWNRSLFLFFLHSTNYYIMTESSKRKTEDTCHDVRKQRVY